MSVALRQRFSRRHPCPICGGYPEAARGKGVRCHGFASADGRYAHCTREELAGKLPVHEASGTFAHQVTGDCRCGVRHGEPAERKPAGRIVAEYDYIDEHGVRLYQVVRLEPKAFRQRRENTAGAWTWKLGDVRRILYRLPELQDADPAAPVFVAEGEKDVDRLRDLGMVATCNPGGAGRWRSDYSQHLAGRAVVIIADRDRPGRVHAQQVAATVHGIAASVRVLELPPGKDASDWIDAGGTATKLHALAAAAPEWQPTPVSPKRARALELRAAAEQRGPMPAGLSLRAALEHGTPWRCPVPGTEDMHQVARAIVEFVEQARLVDPGHPWGKATDGTFGAALDVHRRTVQRWRRTLIAQGWVKFTAQFTWKGLRQFQDPYALEAGPRLAGSRVRVTGETAPQDRARIEAHGAGRVAPVECASRWCASTSDLLRRGQDVSLDTPPAAPAGPGEPRDREKAPRPGGAPGDREPS